MRIRKLGLAVHRLRKEKAVRALERRTVRHALGLPRGINPWRGCSGHQQGRVVPDLKVFCASCGSYTFPESESAVPRSRATY